MAAELSDVSAYNERLKYPVVVERTIQKIEQVGALEDNWDSYGARRPTTKAVIGAAELAAELLESGMPEPHVFPMPNGNIQFEWSCHSMDIEIEIKSRTSCVALVEYLDTQEEWEEGFEFDFIKLREAISELAKRAKTKRSLRVVND